jgi:hypothetical protein
VLQLLRRPIADTEFVQEGLAYVVLFAAFFVLSEQLRGRLCQPYRTCSVFLGQIS